MFNYLSPAVSNNVHPNPGPVPLHKFNNISPLDVFEPLSVSPPLPTLRIANLNARSVCNKSAIIYNHMVENNLDILCVTETWINNGDISSSLLSSSLLPPNYDLVQHCGRPLSMPGVAIIKHISIMLIMALCLTILLLKLKIFLPLNVSYICMKLVLIV